LALEHDLIQKSGSFFSHGETRLGQGRNNTKQFLRDNPELTAKLTEQIFARVDASKEMEEEDSPPGPRAVPDPPPEPEAKGDAQEPVKDAKAEDPKAEDKKAKKKKAA
jgi:recombination protein RecA